MFLRNIFEAIQRTGQGKTAVIGWGRGMGHKGHMMLASSVITQAGKVGGDPYFVVSKTVGKDDPITPDEKIAIYKKVFPQSGHIFQPATDEIPDLTRVLQNLNQQGYTSVTVVLGAAQVKAFQYLKNYNNKPDKSGNILYSFDNLDVISRQETGDPSAGEEGPRATPMRQVLMDPAKSEQEQFAVWRDAMSPEIGDDEVRDLMMKAKERMTAMNAPKTKKAKGMAEEVQEEPGPQHRVAVKVTDPNTYDDVEKIVRVDATDKQDAIDRVEEYYDKKGIYIVNIKYLGMVGQSVAEGESNAMAVAAKRLTDPNDGKTAKLRAAGDKKRDSHYMSTQIAKNDRTSKDEWGNLKELSSEKLGQYKKAAGAQASAADKVGDTKRADKRFSGIVKATKKQFANDEKKVSEKMLPKSAFAGSNKNKLGSAGQLKGSMKRPARAGDLVGGAEESIENEAKQRLDPSCWKGYKKQGTKMKGDTRVNNCVKVSEGVEDIMDNLINKIITNEAIQNNRK